jgi:NADH-quinone oxidoreductase subunit E
MNDTFDKTVIDAVIEERGCRPSSVIAVLQGIQEHYRYLPKEVFPYLSSKLGVSE